jgi:hypothetical protein
VNNEYLKALNKLLVIVEAQGMWGWAEIIRQMIQEEIRHEQAS